MKQIINKVQGCNTAPMETFRHFQGNLKTIESKNLKKLKESIIRKGFTAPLFIWQNNILDGHQRKIALESLKQEGYQIPEIPYVIIEATSEREAKEILLTYASQYEDVDRAGLEEFIKEASLSAFDLDEFTVLPLDHILEAEVEEDNYEINLSTEPKSKLGDVYQLGKHRLIVGDSTDPKVWEKLMDGKKAQMCFTDPPYNVDYHSRGENLKSKGKSSIENDKMEDGAFEHFLTDFSVQLADHIEENAGVYVCYSSSKHIQFENALKNAGFAIKNQIIWVKEIASMGWGDYRWRHEPILYCTLDNGKGTFFNGDRTHTTVMGDKEGKIKHAGESVLVQINGQSYEVVGEGLKILKVKDGLTTIWREKRESNYEHPTQKPIDLVKRALLNSSKKGDIVIDPFGGSGATLITCEKTDRVCFTIELDPAFADVIIDRWEKLTEQKAIKI